jgi:mRNA interferase MazF
MTPALRRGMVVIVDFGPQAKTRPALIVQNDRDNARMTNSIVVQITSNVDHAHEATQHFIDSSHPDWKQSALRRPSVVKCSNIAYVRQQDIVRVIGTLSVGTMLNIDECLKAALGIR